MALNSNDQRAPKGLPRLDSEPGVEYSAAVIRIGELFWRAKDLELIDRLAAVGRNVLICGAGGTGKSALAALLAGRIARAQPQKHVLCVLERYDQEMLGEAEGVVPDPGALKLLAALRKGRFPACDGLVLDEIYTSSGAHGLLEAWRRGAIGVGTLRVSHPEHSDCLEWLAALDQARPPGFSCIEVRQIYRDANPVLVRAVHPGVFETCRELPAVPASAEGESCLN